VTLGERITRRREALKLSQEELAEKSGVSFNTLWLIENDRVACPLRTVLDRLAQALELGDGEDLLRFGARRRSVA
jgi:transcriptional regulator with XRE-family HTH domain